MTLCMHRCGKGTFGIFSLRPLAVSGISWGIPVAAYLFSAHWQGCACCTRQAAGDPASICWTTAEADLVVGSIPLNAFVESPACLQVMLNAMYVSIWIG